jgi:hypothetical protein
MLKKIEHFYPGTKIYKSNPAPVQGEKIQGPDVNGNL